MSHQQEIEFESLSAPAGSIKLKIKGDDYLVRVMRPSAAASLHELQNSICLVRLLSAELSGLYSI